MGKNAKRGKGGTSFVSVVKAALDKGVTDTEEVIKIAKKELPGIDEKKLRARVNATIKYLGKKPAKKVKAEKLPKAVKPAKEVVKKEEKKAVESPKVVPAVVPAVVTEAPKTVAPAVTSPETAQTKLNEALAPEKKDEGLGDIVIQ